MRVGTDLIEIERIRRALDRPRFRERCYTQAERVYCESRSNPVESYAARFAGKEAVGKALGCGVLFTWKEIEIVRREPGGDGGSARGRGGSSKPSVTLSGKTAEFAARTGVVRIDLSMTHSRDLASAVCVVEEAKVGA